MLLIEEAIDTLLSMKGKLSKEERRHLDDARQEKQVREHVIQEVQDLPLVRSSQSRKSGLPQRVPPLKCMSSPYSMVITLES